MVTGLSTASTAEVSIYLVNGATAKFTVNMKGFSQALADLGK
jgi:sRNA-binding regulator protein Hfq